MSQSSLYSRITNYLLNNKWVVGVVLLSIVSMFVMEFLFKIEKTAGLVEKVFGVKEQVESALPDSVSDGKVGLNSDSRSEGSGVVSMFDRFLFRFPDETPKSAHIRLYRCDNGKCGKRSDGDWIVMQAVRKRCVEDEFDSVKAFLKCVGPDRVRGKRVEFDGGGDSLKRVLVGRFGVDIRKKYRFVFYFKGDQYPPYYMDAGPIHCDFSACIDGPHAVVPSKVKSASLDISKVRFNWATINRAGMHEGSAVGISVDICTSANGIIKENLPPPPGYAGISLSGKIDLEISFGEIDAVIFTREKRLSLKAGNCKPIKIAEWTPNPGLAGREIEVEIRSEIEDAKVRNAYPDSVIFRKVVH